MSRALGPPGVVTVAQGDGTSNSVISCGISAAYANVGAISAWVLFQSVIPGAGESSAFAITDGTGNNRVTWFTYADTLQVYLVVGGTIKVSNTLGTSYNNRWHHYAITWSAAGCTEWIDGVSVYSSVANLATTLGAAPTFSLGDNVFGAGLFGATAIVGLYTSLTQAQATSLAGSALPSTIPTHVESWPGNVPLTATSWPGVNGHTATFGSTTKLRTPLLRGLSSGRAPLPAPRLLKASASFNGTSTQITSGSNTGIVGSTPITIGAAVYVTSTSTYNTIVLVGSVAAVSGWILGLRFGSVDLTLPVTGGTFSVLAKVPLNQWVEVVATYSGGPAGTISIYVNAVPQALSATVPSNSPAVVNAPMLIGGGDGFFSSGLIQDVRLWDVCLTPAQVLTNYMSRSTL